MNPIGLLNSPGRRALVIGMLVIVGGCTPGCGTPFEVRETMTLTAPASAALILVDNRVGRIEVIAETGLSEIQATVVKVGKGASLDAARQALAEISVSLTPLEGEALTLTAKADHPGGNGLRQYEVQWTIKAPPSTALEVRNEVGAIAASGFMGGANLATDVGGIDAKNIGGGLIARTDVGSIDATASGAIELTSNVGDVRVEIRPENPGSVRVRTQVGGVSLAIPENRSGLFVFKTDVGCLAVHLSDLQLTDIRSTEHNFEGVAGPSRTPTVDAATDVGSLLVRAYPPPP